MVPTWAFVCSTALALVFVGSASEDDRFIEQREVTFDISQIMQEIQQPDSSMLQKELDLSELLDPKRIGDSSLGFVPRASRPHFGPRSYHPLESYPVQFPLARPSSENLNAICFHGDHRPRYPKSYFPQSGYDQQKRMADAVNMAEAWFETCCKHNQTEETDREVTLCCVTQAWKKSVNVFCRENSRVKDHQYHCCKSNENERLACFHNDAPKPNYEPTEVLPVQPLPPPSTNFHFDSSACQRTSMTPYSIREGGRRKKERKPPTPHNADINFPPAVPTEANIESMCRNQKLRPLYNIKCLAGLGYDLLARQAKTINRMEKGFKQCCKRKQNVLPCAHLSWQEEIKKFCTGAKGKKVDFHCCGPEVPHHQFECFQSISADPGYNKTAITDNLSLSNVCDSHKIITKKFPVGFSLKSLVNKCCPQSKGERSICIPQTLKEMLEEMCLPSQTFPPAVRRCCRLSSSESPQCFNKIVMDAITKATSFSHQKKKQCPIS